MKTYDTTDTFFSLKLPKCGAVDKITLVQIFNLTQYGLEKFFLETEPIFPTPRAWKDTKN